MTRNGTDQPDSWKVVPLGGEAHNVFVSPDASSVRLGHPSVTALQSGRLVLVLDLSGPGVKAVPGPKGRDRASGRLVQGVVLASGDGGMTWKEKTRFGFGHALTFREGATLYALGHKGNIQIMRSADGGELWSRPADITDEAGAGYTLGPANVLLTEQHVFAVFMRNTDPSVKGNPASVLAPVVLRAPRGVTLSNPRVWTVTDSGTSFRDLVRYEDLDHFGVPHYAVPNPKRGEPVGKGLWANRIGWQETHLLQILDPGHPWHDPQGETLHLLARTHSHRGDLAALATLTPDETSGLRVGLQNTPAGTSWAFSPLPGGSLRFSLLEDPVSRHYWLLSHQMRDTIARPDGPGRRRRVMPFEERGPLQLSFSRNLVDWCFAGCVDLKTSSRDPCMAIAGNDLVIAAHTRRRQDDGTLEDAVTCRTVPAFRDLLYGPTHSIGLRGV